MEVADQNVTTDKSSKVTEMQRANKSSHKGIIINKDNI